MEANELLVAMAIEENGSYARISERLRERRTPSDETLQKAQELISGGFATSYLDGKYSEHMKSVMMTPPYALFSAIRPLPEKFPEKLVYVQTPAPDWNRVENAAINMLLKRFEEDGTPWVEIRKWTALIHMDGKVYDVSPCHDNLSSEALTEVMRFVSCLCSEAYFIHLRKGDIDIRLASLFANANATIYALPHILDPEDLCNGMIENGCEAYLPR